jgi:hypothetical protein
MLRRTLSLLLLACALLGVHGRVAANANPQHNQIVSLINSERNLAGLPTQQINPALQSVAQLQANNMAASANVTHFSVDGSNANIRSATVGYNGDVNEIIFGGTAEPAGIVKWWMNSDSHRPIILTEKFTEVGVATAYNAETGWTYWCMIFGAPNADIAAGASSFVQVPRVDATATEPEPDQVMDAAPEPQPAAIQVATAPTTVAQAEPAVFEPVAEVIAEPVVAAPPVAGAEANVAVSAESSMQVDAIANVGMGGGGGDNSYVPSQTSAESEATSVTYAATSSLLDPIHLVIAVIAIIAAAALIFVGYLKPKRHFDPFRRNY